MPASVGVFDFVYVGRSFLCLASDVVRWVLYKLVMGALVHVSYYIFYILGIVAM